MLVLSRKIDQEVIIGNQLVTVKVVGKRGNRVVLGFTAPKEIGIRRKEAKEDRETEVSRPGEEPALSDSQR